MMIIYILGRQPAIGLAELESLYGTDKVRPVGTCAALVSVDRPVNFADIGGAMKVAHVFATYDTTDWSSLQKQLQQTINQQIKQISDGKLKLGISAYGFAVSPAKIIASGLSIKKVIQANGRSVRLVPNTETNLNSAQVLHNKLTSELGWELLIIRDKNQTIIARTMAVQDINSYTLRDRGRPKRDARVGMLPPKLAQTIINLAAGLARLPNLEGSALPEERDGANWKLESNTPDQLGSRVSHRLLDPFCGTGVILQEATLMGCRVYGTDLDPRMVDYSKENLKWLEINWELDDRRWTLDVGDATNMQWQQPIDLIATETYLGRPFTSEPSYEILQQTINDCDMIIKKFLKNIGSQIQPDARLCLAVPTWFVGDKTYHLKTLDQLNDLGYNRISFVHADNKNLVYRRVGQIVGRELLVLSRK